MQQCFFTGSGSRRLLSALMAAASVSGTRAWAETYLHDTAFSKPQDIAVNTATNHVYTVNRGNGTVTVLDGSNNAIRSTITLPNGDYAAAVAANATANRVYVAAFTQSGGNKLYAVSGATDSIVDSATLPDDGGSVAIALNPGLNRAYVAMSTDVVAVVDTTSDTVTGTLTLPFDSGVSDVEVDTTSNRMFTANSRSGTLSVFESDGTTPLVNLSLPNNAQPRSLAFNASTRRIFTANTDGTVSVISNTLGIVATITVSSTALFNGIVVDSAANLAYVLRDDDTVSIINGAANTVVGAISLPVNSDPYAAALNPSTHRLFTADYIGNGVSMVDTTANAVLSTTRGVGFGVAGVAVNPSTNRVYTANYGSISVVDGGSANVIAAIPMPPQTPLNAVAVNPSTNRVYAVGGDVNGNIYVVDGAANTLLAAPAIPGGATAVSVAVNTATNRVYTGDFNSSSSGSPGISVFDGASNTFLTTISLPGGSPTNNLAVNASTNRVYAAGFYNNSLTVIDGANNTVLTTLPLSINMPMAVAVDAAANRVYVAGDDAVAVVDGAANAVIATIHLPSLSATTGIAVYPVLGRVYTSDYNHDALSVLDTTTNTYLDDVALPPGSTPRSVAVNLATGRIYTANQNTSTVSFLAGGGPVAMAATGISTVSATLSVNESSTAAAMVSFEYGPDTNYGSAMPSQTVPAGGTTVFQMLTSLLPGKTYHVRAKAVEAGGTIYSKDVTFTTLLPSSGTALALDGVSAFASAPYSSDLDPSSGGVAVEAWVKPTSFGAPQYVVSLGTSDLASGQYGLLLLPDGHASFHMFDYGHRTANSTSVLPAGAWTHLAGVWDGTTITVYVNGVAEGSAPEGGPLGQVTGDLQIGRLSPVSYPLKGQLDDLRVWTQARSAAQIAASFNKRLTGSEPGLARCYRFDEGVGTTALDSGPDGIAATLQGGAAWSPSGAFDDRTPGPGAALQFDGVDDAVSVPPPPAAITDTFTMEIWAKPSQTRATTEEAAGGITGIGGQRYAVFPTLGSDAYGSDDAGAGISIGTNGVSVFEHSAYYLASPLVWTAPSPLSDWTHVAVVYANKQPKLYINGVLVRTGVAGTRVVHPSASLSAPAPYAGYGAYQGQLDEARIWKTARTQAQIQSTLHQALTGGATGLLAVWNMDEDAGPSINDGVAGLVGTLQNGPVWLPGSAPIVAGFSMADAVRALRIAGGLASAASSDARLNLEGTGSAITLLDAVRLARKAAGTDANP